MRRAIQLVALVGVIGAASCSSAVPFVTSISSDGRGGIVVEKNTVEFNHFTGTISSGDNPTTSTIQLRE